MSRKFVELILKFTIASCDTMNKTRHYFSCFDKCWLRSCNSSSSSNNSSSSEKSCGNGWYWFSLDISNFYSMHLCTNQILELKPAPLESMMLLSLSGEIKSYSQQFHPFPSILCCVVLVLAGRGGRSSTYFHYLINSNCSTAKWR